MPAEKLSQAMPSIIHCLETLVHDGELVSRASHR
jgi:hypothetical protein